MSQSFGSGLKPVEIPHPEQSGASAGTTPTFSPANKPTPLIGSWADIGWEKAGEPTSATLASANAAAAAAGAPGAERTGGTPLLPSSVSAFEGRGTPGTAHREGTDDYLNNLLTETAKIADEHDDDDAGEMPPQRSSTPPPASSTGRPNAGTTYGRVHVAVPRMPDNRHVTAHQGPKPYGGGFGQVHPQAAQGFQPGPQQPFAANFAGMYAGHPHHHHHHHHHHHPQAHQHQGFHGHPHQLHQHQPAPLQARPHGPQPGFGGGFGVSGPLGHADRDAFHGNVGGPHDFAPSAPYVTKFTPPPPPTVALATELGAPDSDTPANKVGDVLFSLGRRWVQRLETWLAAHPKERPNAPCPAAEQYATIETWLEKLNAWYEANFNGRKVSTRQGRGGRGRGGATGGSRGRQPPTASQHAPRVPDEQPSFGTAW